MFIYVITASHLHGGGRGGPRDPEGKRYAQIIGQREREKDLMTKGKGTEG